MNPLTPLRALSLATLAALVLFGTESAAAQEETTEGTVAAPVGEEYAEATLERLKALQKEFEAEREARLLEEVVRALESNQLDRDVLRGRIADLERELALERETREDAALAAEVRFERRLGDLEAAIARLQRALDETRRARESLADQIEALKKEIAALSERVEGIPVTKGPDAEVRLDLARTLLDQDHPGEARRLAGEVLAGNPPAEVSARARYLIGESHYAEKNYPDAVLAFHDVVSDFPRSAVAPDALWREAMALALMGRSEDASWLFRRLLDEYPGSEPARRVREELAEFKEDEPPDAEPEGDVPEAAQAQTPIVGEQPAATDESLTDEAAGEAAAEDVTAAEPAATDKVTPDEGEETTGAGPAAGGTPAGSTEATDADGPAPETPEAPTETRATDAEAPGEGLVPEESGASGEDAEPATEEPAGAGDAGDGDSPDAPATGEDQ